MTTGTITELMREHDNGIDVNKDSSSCCSASSVDTEEAFMDVFGLTSIHDLASAEEQEEKQDDHENHNIHQQSTSVPLSSHLKFTPINLPKKVSRHSHPPSDCFALMIDDVLSPSDCQHLIQLASNKSSSNNQSTSKSSPLSSSFRYITEAAHKASDGSTFMVKLQNPNPHKLAILDTCTSATATANDDFPTLIRKRLYDRICHVLNIHTLFEKFQKRQQCGSPQGLNPRLRILKYDAIDNDRFEPHFDATTYVDNFKQNIPNATTAPKEQLKSFITVLLYLNDGDGEDFSGGETLYLDASTNSKSSSSSTTTTSTTTTTTATTTKVVPKTGRVVVFEHDLFHSGAPLTFGTKYILRTDILFEDNANSDGNRSRNNCGSANDKDTQDSTNKIGVATATASDTENNNNKPKLIEDLCYELQISSENMELLDQIGLLYISCESFLAPGITCLKQMLLEIGFGKQGNTGKDEIKEEERVVGREQKMISLLIERAFAIMKEQ